MRRGDHRTPSLLLQRIDQQTPEFPDSGHARKPGRRRDEKKLLLRMRKREA